MTSVQDSRGGTARYDQSPWDVLVIGGGPAGIGAATAAARNGARTLLVEAGNCLGGMGTAGLVGMIRTAGDGGGIIREVRDRMCELDCVRESRGWHHSLWLDPFAYRTVACETVRMAGAQVLLHAQADGVAMECGRIAGAYVAAKGGRLLLKARAVVDATGDGDIAAWAGAPFEKGRVGDGYLQAVSLNFDLVGIDASRLPPWEEFRRLTRQAIASGELDLPPYVQALPLSVSGGEMHCQLDLATGVDASDAAGLSDGEMLCQDRAFRIWRFLRSRVSGFENCRVARTASYLGVRETRRILGAYVLTESDVLGARKFADGVCRCSFYMDLHDGQPKSPEYIRQRRPPEGEFYEIPYRCLLPRDVEGLLVAGRCISADRPASGSVRLQPTCMNTGQAAGTAAAICAREGIAPSQLPGERLRAVLVEQGMEL